MLYLHKPVEAPFFLTHEEAMSDKFTSLMAEVNQNLAELRKSVPEVSEGFSALAKGATKEGILNKKFKELIAISIAVSTRCDACIGFHVSAFIRHGGTREELMEALGMAVYMGGGPSLMYAANTIGAYDELMKK